MSYPDAMEAEPIFQVNGAPADEIEQCAAENMANETFSHSREVRVRIFDWPRRRADVLAVVQYRFIGASPAGSCWSVALLVHLTRPGAKAVERRLISLQHHAVIVGLRLVDLTGDGVEELVLEPDFGGGATVGSSLKVFDLTGRRFREVLSSMSRLEYMTDEYYAQVLDVPRSVAQTGRAICFELTTFVKDGKSFPKPRVSYECYPSGTGVDEK